MATLDGPRRDSKSGAAQSLVVLLHGYGADGADLIGIGDALADHMPDTVFLAPNAPERCAVNPMGRQWFPIPMLDGSTPEAMREGAVRAAALLHRYLDDLVETEGVPAAQTCLFGFSQGTMMALEVGPRRKDALAGIVGFSGRLNDPEALARDVVTRPPVLLVHGDMDEMVPLESLDAAKRGLEAAGIEVATHVSRGVGHGIAPDGLGLALGFLKKRLG